jgi:erythromycin esterase-like protein
MTKKRSWLDESFPGDREALIDRLKEISRPLEAAGDLDPLLERIGTARYVLLGEASHGTSEYYAWRFQISRRLIEEEGFSFIAVEGDWPDCYRVNRYVKGAADAGATAGEVLHAFDRWPTWMWANEEAVWLAEWLRQHNDRLLKEERVGFYGLDVYSLWDSMNAVIGYLEPIDPAAAEEARRAYRCFEPYAEDVEEYARATAFVPTSCEREVVNLLSLLRRKVREYPEDREAAFNAEQNAWVVKNAEAYYRTMIKGGAASWNLRDHHMVDTLERLMAFHGPNAKGIVWAHNTHIGDARATDMARAGMVNVGQLVRERHGAEEVVLAGFGSYRGSVIAALRWGAQMAEMPVPPAMEGSFEELLHRAGAKDQLFVFQPEDPGHLLHKPRGHRAIGVVYDPEDDFRHNYVPTVLPFRYDAFLYFDRSRALRPLHLAPRKEGDLPETYPFAA